jgi:hypothetical protein
MMLSRRIHQVPTIWIFALIVLSTAPEARIGDVQVLEVVQVVRFLLVLALFASTGMKLPKADLWKQYGLAYTIFLGLVFIVSLSALRLDFYPPSQISILKQPFFLSLSRLLELALAVYFMLAIGDSLNQKPALLRKALTAYTAAGVVSAAASVAAFIIFQTTGQTTYFINELDNRVQGFFNEGGPYGLFLTSVVLLLMLRRRLFPTVSRLWHWFALILVAIAWILSFSKAGLLATILCGAVAGTCIRSLPKRLLAVAVLPIALIGFFLVFQREINGYVNSITGFDEWVLFRPNDRNLVMGRIVASFIVPRMIAAHPLLGIGLGNYSLVRNDPEYLQGLPAVDDWDLPGLGLISDAAELGIPLTLFLMLLISRPLLQIRRSKGFPALTAIAGFQPIAVLLGVNLNFFYPWLVTGFVLASLNQATGAWRLDHDEASLASSITR